MDKTSCSQCRGPGFNPWSGNQIPHATTKSSHAATEKKKKKRSRMLNLKETLHATVKTEDLVYCNKDRALPNTFSF